MKKCRECAEYIQDDARVCRYCGDKADSIGDMFAIKKGGCLGLVVLVIIIALLAPERDKTTENTILAAQRACELQTGQPCSVP